MNWSAPRQVRKPIGSGALPASRSAGAPREIAQGRRWLSRGTSSEPALRINSESKFKISMNQRVRKSGQQDLNLHQPIDLAGSRSEHHAPHHFCRTTTARGRWDGVRRQSCPTSRRQESRAGEDSDGPRRPVKAAEKKHDFPRVSVFGGGRFWPAVFAWLCEHEGIQHNGAITGTAADGPQTFDAAPRKRPRSQARSHVEERRDPLVLDSGAGRARPDGLSGQVHSLAARRRR